MNIDQVAQALGVSRRTIYNWMSAGWLAYTVRGGSRHVELEAARGLLRKDHGSQPRDPRGCFVKAPRGAAA
jgi:excisionase family DNA binding protein